MKRKLRLYLDSSVLGFAVIKRPILRRTEANRLLQQIRDGLFIGAYSFVTEAEIDAAPPWLAKRLRRKITASGLRRIRVRSRSKVADLATRYCREGIIPREYFEDALHIAAATLWRADALISFNFAHIVRLETMIRVNSVNTRLGLKEIFLCQPIEVILG